jgi:hypothetical protein
MDVPITGVDARPGAVVLERSRVPIANVIEALEAGEAPSEIFPRMGVDPGEVVAAAAFAALGDEPDALPLVQSRPRRPRLRAPLGEQAMAALFPAASRARCVMTRRAISRVLCVPSSASNARISGPTIRASISRR